MLLISCFFCFRLDLSCCRLFSLSLVAAPARVDRATVITEAAIRAARMMQMILTHFLFIGYTFR